MRKLVSLLTIILFTSLDSFSQNVDSTHFWTLEGVNTFQFSQASFSNWTSGGQNSLTFITGFRGRANRKSKRDEWETFLDAAFGTQSIENKEYRKSEDRFEVSSKYGVKASDKLYTTFLGSLRSQFIVGYKYNNDGTLTKVSDFLSPGYFIASFGLDYKPFNGLSLYISPFGSRSTIVADQELADKGAYGVKKAVIDTATQLVITPGEHFLHRVGLSSSFRYGGPIFENVNLTTKLDLFTTYDNLNAIDVYWETLFDFKINRFFTANLSTGLIYDQKVLIRKQENVNGVLTEVARPRVQFKEIISLGFKFSY